MRKSYIIEDWAGNRKWAHKIFASFEDGIAFLQEEVPKEYPNLSDDELDEQIGEYYVINLTNII